jgi:hypothetical protein
LMHCIVLSRMNEKQARRHSAQQNVVVSSKMA